jgi:2-hydroxychromene-2-carboxylate isomerase
VSLPREKSGLAGRFVASPQLVERALSPENKERLRRNVEEAAMRGLFGAPSFTVGDELFWGDDRLEDAIDWATANTSGSA